MTPITPELILKWFSQRLEKKAEALEFLSYMDKRFEKWLQCELVLAMHDKHEVIPAVFDNKYIEISCKFEGKQEKICDIAIEYNVDATKKDSLRSDVIISETPFLQNYVNEDDWIIRSSDDIETCKDLYKKSNFHYIEIKQRNWIDIQEEQNKEIGKLLKLMKEDIDKYDTAKMKHWKYSPSCIISICCVSFWKKEVPLREVPHEELIEKFKLKLEKMEKADDLILVHEEITNEVLLLMLYKKVGI